jgi:hypothetical protein
VCIYFFLQYVNITQKFLLLPAFLKPALTIDDGFLRLLWRAPEKDPVALVP